jgi:hypothetical protein
MPFRFAFMALGLLALTGCITSRPVYPGSPSRFVRIDPYASPYAVPFDAPRPGMAMRLNPPPAPLHPDDDDRHFRPH